MILNNARPVRTRPSHHQRTKLHCARSTLSAMISTLLLLLLCNGQARQAQLANAPFHTGLMPAGKHRRDHRIPRSALLSPLGSPFMTLFLSANDQALITLTGFSHAAFEYIQQRFAPLYAAYTPYSTTGMIRKLRRPARRPRSLNALQCLGLVLAWGRTRGSCIVLCMLFGVTSSVTSLFLRFGRRILLKALAQDNKSAVKMPNTTDTETFKAAFSAKYSTLVDVYAVADGLKLYLEQAGDCVTQNMFYNGWTHDHYVGNVFVFSPDGCIIAFAVNAPGAMHDSTIAEWGNIYQKLEKLYNRCGGRCVVDSAFCKGQYPFLIKSAQDHLTTASTAAEVVHLRQATSAQQASERGMRALQGSFPRLKDRLPYEERGERKLILMSIVRLFNLRARLVGVNQLLSSYMPHLRPEANYLLYRA